MPGRLSASRFAMLFALPFSFGFVFTARSQAASLTTSAAPHITYASPTSQEGHLKFSAHVDLAPGASGTEAEYREEIRKQLLYVIGNMQYGVGGIKGTPSMGYTLTNLHVRNGSARTRVDYDFETRVIVEKGMPQGRFTVDLPNSPSETETLDRALCNEAEAEPMWYGFNPRRDGCPLQDGRDYTTYDADLTLDLNTRSTYPEYAKLVENGKIRMDVFLNSEIERADAFENHLVQAGFQQTTWTRDQIAAYLKFVPTDMPVIEDFVKGPLKIRLFFGAARVENRDAAKAFHFFYKDALENANVVVYNGHSGLGSNIDLNLIEKNENFEIHLKPTYQLYFLGGCITYSYYVDKYLARKATPADPRGTQQLDILGFGQESPGFDSRPLIALSRAIEAFALTGQQTSYQTITNQITYSWFGVVGDEDNAKP